jgi:hypothetical protein
LCPVLEAARDVDAAAGVPRDPDARDDAGTAAAPRPEEDSWQILSVDQNDARGQLWRISEAHCINYYDQLTLWSTVEVHTDLLAGRYIALGLDNEDKMYDFSVERTPQDYTPASLRMDGIR